MKKYFKAWNFMRVLRLALGLFILVQGIVTKEWIFAILGAMFALLPLLNIGCCGTQSCNAHFPKPTKQNQDLDFEEIK